MFFLNYVLLLQCLLYWDTSVYIRLFLDCDEISKFFTVSDILIWAGLFLKTHHSVILPYIASTQGPINRIKLDSAIIEFIQVQLYLFRNFIISPDLIVIKRHCKMTLLQSLDKMHLQTTFTHKYTTNIIYIA